MRRGIWLFFGTVAVLCVPGLLLMSQPRFAETRAASECAGMGLVLEMESKRCGAAGEGGRRE